MMFSFMILVLFINKNNSTRHFNNYYISKGGVNNIHGLPGILSGIASAVVAALATRDTYGDRYILFSL